MFKQVDMKTKVFPYSDCPDCGRRAGICTKARHVGGELPFMTMFWGMREKTVYYLACGVCKQKWDYTQDNRAVYDAVKSGDLIKFNHGGKRIDRLTEVLE